MTAPLLVKEIPSQVINEQASFAPLNLNDFITNKEGDDEPIHFVGELDSGAALPKGMICTENGILTGIPAKGTGGGYVFKITATNEAGSLVVTFDFTIKLAIAKGAKVETDINDLKAQVWKALENKLPVPDIAEITSRAMTAEEMYYLLERFAYLTIWDAVNLDSLGDKVLLNLEDASPHYNVYDRGTCLVASPKDLFSHERTLKDALQTARAMAREVYRRGWIIEFTGFDKMQHALWVELQHLEDVHGKKLEILRYDPSFKELRIYTEEAKGHAMNRMENP